MDGELGGGGTIQSITSWAVCAQMFLLISQLYNMGFSSGSASKEFTHNAADLGSIPGLGRFPGEGKGYPLQYSVLENAMDCIP